MSASYSEHGWPDQGRVPAWHLLVASTIGAVMWTVAAVAIWWAL